MTNRIDLKDRNTIAMLRDAVKTTEIKTSQRRLELEDPTHLEIATFRSKEAEYNLLYAQLCLEWRISLNKEYAHFADAIEKKKDKLQADLARIDVERAQQLFDEAEATYRSINNAQH